MKCQSVPFQKCLFVCENERAPGKACCGPAATGLREYLKAAVKNRGLTGKIRVAKAGCLDHCSTGPNIFVFPDNLWYSAITREDWDRIVEEQLPIA